MIGKKFGILIVISKNNDNKGCGTKWLCKCNCGKTKIIRGNNLTIGHTKSCGCLNKYNNLKHGHKKNNKTSYIYTIWKGMIQRCTNSNSISYHNYGGRGISVCKKWLKFKNFLNDMGEQPTNKHQIDRTDNNEGYYKDNCRWATIIEQARNRRSNHLVTFNGKTQCLSGWSEELHINQNTLWARLNRGWSIEKTLTVPVAT